MYQSRFFKDEEFEACSPACLREQINEDSLRRLDAAREIAGTPFVLSSAYRSPDYERKKKRSGTGAHTKGCAFDVLCVDSQCRWRIVFGALAAGFKRIGIAPTFIHLDDSFDHPNPRIWLY